ERGPAMQADVADWLGRQRTDAARLQALWLCEAIHVVDPSLLRQVLAADDGRIRAAAVRVLGEWADRLPEGQRWLAERVADDHPRVRLEAVRALAGFPSVPSADTALRVLDKPMDRFLDYALWLTVNELADPLLAAVEAGTLPARDD